MTGLVTLQCLKCNVCTENVAIENVLLLNGQFSRTLAYRNSTKLERGQQQLKMALKINRDTETKTTIATDLLFRVLLLTVFVNT